MFGRRRRELEAEVARLRHAIANPVVTINSREIALALSKLRRAMGQSD